MSFTGLDFGQAGHEDGQGTLVSTLAGAVDDAYPIAAMLLSRPLARLLWPSRD